MRRQSGEKKPRVSEQEQHSYGCKMNGLKRIKATALQSYALLGGIIHCFLALENIRKTSTEYQVHLCSALIELNLLEGSSVAIPALATKQRQLYGRLGTLQYLPNQSARECKSSEIRIEGQQWF